MCCVAHDPACTKENSKTRGEILFLERHGSQSVNSAGTGSLDVVWLQQLSPTCLYQLVEFRSADAHIPAGRTEKPLEPGFRWRLVHGTLPVNAGPPSPGARDCLTGVADVADR